MNWDAIGAFGEVFGALAVFLTLIYLAAQLRQHTKAMEETRKVELSRNAQMRTEHRILMQKTAIENEHVRNAVSKMRGISWPESKDKLTELTSDEFESYRHFLVIQVLILENLWYQGEQKLIDETLVENIFPAIKNFGHIWKETGAIDTVREEFKLEVDRVLGETGV